MEDISRLCHRFIKSVIKLLFRLFTRWEELMFLDRPYNGIAGSNPV